MFSSNGYKSNVVILFALLGNACGFWQSAGNKNTSIAPPISVAKPESEIPFSTREPDAYQMEILVKGDNLEEKMFAARKGNFRRNDFTFSGNLLILLFQDGGGRQFINPHKKIYAEEKLSEQTLAPPLESWNDFLTADLLNQKKSVKFEKINTENNLTQYRIISDEPAAGGEIIISVDENFGFPVRSEFYGIEGEQKILKFSVEMKNIKLEAEDRIFQVPEGYRKISLEEFRTMLKKESPDKK